MVLAGTNPMIVTRYLTAVCEDTNENAGVNKHLLHTGPMLSVLFHPTEISSIQKFVIWSQDISFLDKLHQSMFHLSSSINMMHYTIHVSTEPSVSQHNTIRCSRQLQFSNSHKIRQQNIP